jgi:hypothetical protein
LDVRYEEEAKNLKIKQWREGHFATGVMDGTWDEAYAKYKRNPKDECFSMSDDDGTPCLCCSAMACSAIGAGRVGNMAVLKQSTEWVEEEEVDENGESTARRFTRPKLDVVVGPVRKRTIAVETEARDSSNVFVDLWFVVLANALLCDLPFDLGSLYNHFVHRHSGKASSHHSVLVNLHSGSNLLSSDDGLPRSRYSSSVRESTPARRQRLEME